MRSLKNVKAEKQRAHSNPWEGPFGIVGFNYYFYMFLLPFLVKYDVFSKKFDRLFEDLI